MNTPKIKITKDLINRTTAKKIHYQEVNNAYQTVCSNLFKNIINNKYNIDDQLVRELQLSVLECEDDILFFYPNNITKCQVSFFVRRSNYDELMIESPHLGKDGTLDVTCQAILNTRCRFMIMNAIHPYSSPKIGTQHSKSDVAHNTDNQFYKIHCVYENKVPNSRFVQLHGMKGAKNFQLLIVNAKNHQFNLKETSFINNFAKQLTLKYNQEQQNKMAFGSHKLNFPNNYKDPSTAHNSNVEGRQVNSGKGDTGRFIHVELGPMFKKYKHFMKICEAINEIFDNEKVNKVQVSNVIQDSLDTTDNNNEDIKEQSSLIDEVNDNEEVDFNDSDSDDNEELDYNSDDEDQTPEVNNKSTILNIQKSESPSVSQKIKIPSVKNDIEIPVSKTKSKGRPKKNA